MLDILTEKTKKKYFDIYKYLAGNFLRLEFQYSVNTCYNIVMLPPHSHRS